MIKLKKSKFGISSGASGGKLLLSFTTSGLNSLQGENMYGDVPPDESVTTFKLELFFAWRAVKIKNKMESVFIMVEI